MKRFSEQMQAHPVKFKQEQQYLPPTNPRKPWEYVEISDNLYPPIRNGFLQYAYDASLDFHDYVRHVRSSQAFCFNLFYPLVKSKTNLRNLMVVFANRLGQRECDEEEWHFEYQPDHDYLGEWQGKENPIDYITSVDFALFFRRKEGTRVAALCEVKFTEPKFSACGGYKSIGNKQKSFCSSSFAMKSVAKRCYLVTKKSRTYFDLTQGSYDTSGGQQCPFLENNQCQRNHAFAKALVSLGKVVDEAYFGLVYHDDNHGILREWMHYKELCKPEERKFLFEVKASEVLSAATDETHRRYFADRYLIEAQQNPV